MSTEITKGYKVTDAQMQCRGFQFELDKTFIHDGNVSLCNEGFHFCQIANNCFNYYDFKPTNRVFEVEASGKLFHGNDKSVCSELKLIREISWAEVLQIVNTGADNTGRGNSGNWNSGNWNSGDRNSGDSNSGDRNSGYRNSGNWNSGDRNSGDSNSGNSNSGDRNSGDRNSGDSNSGNSNSGDRNSGNWNSGDSNSGNWNSGNWNSGNWNSGDRNSGDSNSGNWNSGDRNSGDSNSGYRNSGAFCTDPNPVLYLFNKPTDILVRDWENHEAVRIMSDLDPTIWVPQSIMNDEEKKANPKYETTEGYLKTIPYKEAWANLWHNLSDKKKAVFTSLPNFDAAIFEEITGIRTN